VVGKGTDVSVLTLPDLVRVILAEFRLVLLGMVKVFDTVVRLDAIVILRAHQPVRVRDRAHLRGVRIRHSAAVLQLGVVIEEALLWVVRLINLARLRLEQHQIQQHDG